MVILARRDCRGLGGRAEGVELFGRDHEGGVVFAKVVSKPIAAGLSNTWLYT